MPAPIFDYYAVATVRGQTGVLGYNPGDGMHESAVDNLGLVVGLDVIPARSDLVERPADNAGREDWVRYAVHQGAMLVDLDEMTRTDIQQAYPPADDEPQSIVDSGPTRPHPGAKKDEWVKYAVYMGMDETTASGRTIPELQEAFPE
jgi:hypothetical protein